MGERISEATPSNSIAFLDPEISKIVNGAIPDRIVRLPEACKIAGASPSTVWRWERDGHFPRRRQLVPGQAGGGVGWLLTELAAWLASRPVGSMEHDQLDQIRHKAIEASRRARTGG